MAKRTALIGDQGGSLYLYGLSYLQSLLLIPIVSLKFFSSQKISLLVKITYLEKLEQLHENRGKKSFSQLRDERVLSSPKRGPSYKGHS